jgi:adenine-specific DNA-methyltransferase
MSRLFEGASAGDLPATRYQGSKARLAPLLREVFASLSFDSALDAFSGTASVSWLLKTLKKRVHSNDALRANAIIARALVANEGTTLGPSEARSLFARRDGVAYDDFIARTFRGVFFLDEENAWLDVVARNIGDLPTGPAQALAYYALFQACLKKRPFNLFHRKNLDLRLRDVPRSFGNKHTWETAFAAHFEDALAEANDAVFASGLAHTVTNEDALELEATADLVYADPPYMNARGQSVDYLDHYHFLEGLTELDAWPSRIDRDRPHLPYRSSPSPWRKQKEIAAAFEALFERHRRSILVVSYRADGVPSPTELGAMLERLGKRVRVHRMDQRYALSTKPTHELVFVAE